MNRERAASLLLAVLAVVALAAAAATIPSATESGGAGEGGFVGGGGEGGLIPTPDPPQSNGVPVPASPLWFVLLFVLVAVALVALLRDRRVLLRRLAGIVGVLAVVVLLFWLLSHADLPGGGFQGTGGPLFGQPAGGAGGSAPSSPSTLLLVVLGAVLLVALALVLRGDGLSGFVPEDDEPPEPTEEAADVGRAARRAADRIEASEDVENEIYRAWREMTRLLDVSNPAAATPGEFANAGTAAGMDPEHVEELTRLFEDVRYGGDEPTDAAERRALAVLRRIEAAYDPEGAEG